MNDHLIKNPIREFLSKIFNKNYIFYKHKINNILYFGNNKLVIKNVKFFHLQSDRYNIYYLIYSIIYLSIRLKFNKKNLIKYYYFLQILDVNPKILISNVINKF